MSIGCRGIRQSREAAETRRKDDSPSGLSDPLQDGPQAADQCCQHSEMREYDQYRTQTDRNTYK
jgi:hypothetical protein